MALGVTSKKDSLEKQFSRVLREVDLTHPSSQEFEPISRWLAEVLELQATDVTPALFPSAPVIGPLLRDKLADRKHRLLLGMLLQPEELEPAVRTVSQHLSRDHRIEVAAICVLSRYGEWYIAAIVSRPQDPLAMRIHETISPSGIMHEIVAAPAAAVRGPAAYVPATQLIMEDRVLRMLRLAVASSSAVILVGPPGTGKTTLIKELLQEIAYSPQAFGLAKSPKDPKWVTPAESWTSMDLIGGHCPDEKGRLRFRLGHVLEAIRQDRWLILDEANRANMDRIFGPLLTWLSYQPVDLGRASSDTYSPSVVLDWNNKPQSEAVRLELLESERIMTPEPIRLLAGMDWRLLGTYNAQDASKVFSFGHALSRRFARVPIPAINAAQFQQALLPLVTGLPEAVPKLILGIYASHLSVPAANLGPAIFLRIASYVAAGLQLPQICRLRTGLGLTGNPDEPTRVNITQLVAEAYLTSAGTWLGQLSTDDLSALGQSLMKSGFPQAEWDWVKALLPTLI